MKRAIIFCSMMILSSCAPTKELHRPIPNRSPQEIIDAVNSRRAEITTFDAKGSISIESPSMINSGSFELWLKKPDSVRVEIEGPFGIRVASALFAGDHYLFYNSFRNEVMTGDLRSDALPMILNMRINPEDLINTFCGVRTFLPQETRPDSFATGEDSYVMFFRHPRVSTRYTVDGNSLAITEIEHVDSTDAVLGEEQFEFQTGKDGATMLQSIRFNENKSESSVSLFYDKVHVNGPVAAMSLSVPPDARHVTKPSAPAGAPFDQQ